MVNIENFTCFEERQIAFQNLTNIISPSITAGFGKFVGNITSWFLLRDKGIGYIVSIPADPYIGLVLPTTKDVLYAAASRGGFKDIETAIERVMSLYNLPETKLSQAVRTLSGGESCLLSLAKCVLLGSNKKHLVMCNPESWLSRENRYLIMKAAKSYTDIGGASTILAMDGDMICCEKNDTHNGLLDSFDSKQNIQGPKINIFLDDLCIRLSDPTGISKIKPLSITYSGYLSLRSPIIWEAPNGVGKSVLAGLLSGAINYDKGKYTIYNNGFTGKARVLMQDCIYQLFGFKPIDYLLWTFRESPERASNAVNEYHLIESMISEKIKDTGNIYNIGNRDVPDSLLQAKIALVAARIVQHPVLIVLDEPGFSLTKRIAKAFVDSVAKRCAERNIGLLIISHSSDLYQRIISSSIICQVDQQDCIDGSQRQIIMIAKNISEGTNNVH